MTRLIASTHLSRLKGILVVVLLALVITPPAELAVMAQAPPEDNQVAIYLPIIGGAEQATSATEAGQEGSDVTVAGEQIPASVSDPAILADSAQRQIFLPVVQGDATQGNGQGSQDATSVEAAALPSFTVLSIDPSMAGDVKALGDIDGDGYVDGVVGGDANGEDMVWYKYNSSNGSWTKYPVAEAVSQFTTDMQLGDIDNDGDLDVIVPEEAPGLLAWLENPRPSRNPQLGNWTRRNLATGMGHLHDMEVADVDRDGKLDVIARHGTYLTSDGNVFIFFQNTPTSWTSRTFSFPSGEGLGIGDVDKDGDTDFIVAGKWYENPTNPRTNTWSAHGIVGNPPSDSTSAVADFNGDTRPDIVIVNQHANGTFAWYEGPTNPKTAENGAFLQHVINSNTGSHKVNVADFNNDGFIDIQTSLELADMKIFYNSGGSSPTFTLQTLQYSAHNARVGDIGRDGDIDIFGADWTGRPPVRIWQNQLSSTPVTQTPTPLPTPTLVAIPTPSPVTPPTATSTSTPTPLTPPIATPTRTPTPLTPPTVTPTRTPTSIAPTPTANPSRLVVAYNFSEGSGTTTSDRSGNNNGATLVNGPVWTTGKYGGGLRLDGIDDHLNVVDSASLRPDSGPLTVEMWVQIPNVDQTKRLLSKNNPVAPHTEYMIAVTGRADTTATGKKLLISYWNGGSSYRKAMTVNDFADGNWHHLAFTANPTTDQLIVYVDGVAVPITTESQGVWPSLSNTHPLRIGGNNDNTEMLAGLIDEIRIYKRALAASEIQTDMASPIP